MEISTILIALVIFIFLFLIFREVNLWYWKINERIEIAQKQNMLLEIIADHLTGESYLQKLNKKKSSTDQRVTSNGGISDNSDISEPEEFLTLSEDEKVTVNKYLNYGLFKGDKLVINKRNRNIDRFDKSEWDRILKDSQQNEWEIISEKLY